MRSVLVVIGLWTSVGLLAAGCVTLQERVLDAGTETLRLRSIQSRAFETDDQERTVRTVIATLQDLGFLIEKADATLATVSGTRLGMWGLRMTVTVSPPAQRRVVVRANAQLGQSPVQDPEPYQRFFVALERAMFLTAHHLD